MSSRCSLIDDGGLTAAALADGAWPLFYDPSLDALFVREIEDDVLVLVDVVASRIPTAARILGSLGIRPGRLRSLFPPDQLGWIGRTVADDTGLMVRGRLPPAMHEPFMLPPTAGF